MAGQRLYAEWMALIVNTWRYAPSLLQALTAAWCRLPMHSAHAHRSNQWLRHCLDRRIARQGQRGPPVSGCSFLHSPLGMCTGLLPVSRSDTVPANRVRTGTIVKHSQRSTDLGEGGRWVSSTLQILLSEAVAATRMQEITSEGRRGVSHARYYTYQCSHSHAAART